MTRSGVDSAKLGAKCAQTDGQREGATPIHFEVATNPSPLTVVWSPVGGRPFHGRIDQVRVFDRVVSPAEIESVFNFEPGILRPVSLGVRVSQVAMDVEVARTASGDNIPTR